MNIRGNNWFYLAIVIIDCFVIFGAWQLTQFLLDLDRDMSFIIGWLWVLTIAFALMGAPVMISGVLFIFAELWKKIRGAK